MANDRPGNDAELLLAGKAPEALLADADLRVIARQLFIELDMVRAFEGDYEVAVQTLRRVYDRGRCRGVFEGRD